MTRVAGWADERKVGLLVRLHLGTSGGSGQHCALRPFMVVRRTGVSRLRVVHFRRVLGPPAHPPPLVLPRDSRDAPRCTQPVRHVCHLESTGVLLSGIRADAQWTLFRLRSGLLLVHPLASPSASRRVV